MNIISMSQAVVADQAGVWDGEYVHLDANHTVVDRHRSRLVCRLHDGAEGTAKLSQTNIYTWDDGQQEIRYFDAVFEGDRLWLKNDLIEGWTSAIKMDETQRTIMVVWTRPSEPGFTYYEMITLSEDGDAKNRTWHWYREGRLFQRTVINEERISRDWSSYDDPGYYQSVLRTPT